MWGWWHRNLITQIPQDQYIAGFFISEGDEISDGFNNALNIRYIQTKTEYLDDIWPV
jgi:hypothetical protein